MKAAGDMERRQQTEELRRYDIEGAVLETELCLDELTGLYIEILPDLIEKPVYTAKGNPVMFTGEDACSYGQPRERSVVGGRLEHHVEWHQSDPQGC